MRNLLIGIAIATTAVVIACSSGSGSITGPSAVTPVLTTTGTQPTEAPCNGCVFSALGQGDHLRLAWSGFFKGNNATCEISAAPAAAAFPMTVSPCDEGAVNAAYPLVPTTFTMTVQKNSGNDPPQMMNTLFHGPVGTFAGPTSAASGHDGWLVVVFGEITGDVHHVTAEWNSNVPRDDDPGIMYDGYAIGTDESMSVNATSSTRCGGATGPQAVFSGTFTVVDGNHITGSYNGTACHPSAGTFSLTRQ